MKRKKGQQHAHWHWPDGHAKMGEQRFGQRQAAGATCRQGWRCIHSSQGQEWLQPPTRMFAWWHMAAWWRHVLLSRMHQRAVPCDFIIPFKFRSSSESTFSFLKVRCDYLQWSQSLAKWGSATGEGRAARDAAPLMCLCPWMQSGVNITLPPSQDLFCTACFWKFQVMHKPGTSLLPL